ncbi:hypothetical protein HYDPIDRAFT_113694 [Hydnomerulius pinastri MD-312]|uniref:Unplaced genomic scaffold scaffold_18, whole genome shotgun sequence n=1 Tax=Hydnomerulius pinastri MD-312 TaxID=994086 RepID=A0A0C9WE79_9AGAM|nr:hypothetical protein HYDPIDRAFT_113694 [Hydnomerulius pinastri MD-312]
MPEDTQRNYHTTCTGPALLTVQAHSKPADITLFGSCFCPFVQRVWVALEALGIAYEYYEVDPYKKPKELLALSPKGLVPALRLNTYDPPRALNESSVITEYLEELAANTTGKTLLPPISDPYARALSRLQSDHISRIVVPSFYRYLQAQDPTSQIEHGREFLEGVKGLTELFERGVREGTAGKGLWNGDEIGWADVFIAPWIYRASNVLTHYRGFTMPRSPEFDAWIEKLFKHPAFEATRSTEELYLDSYERYAFNRPNTSQVANAINSGRGLP